MEEDSGVFQRMGASIDARLRTAAASAPGRMIRRAGGWFIEFVAYVVVIGFSAGVGAMLGAVLYLVLHVTGIVSEGGNHATNWWVVIGAAVGGTYAGALYLWFRIREHRENTRDEGDPSTRSASWPE